jgi:hypothetical protein
MAQYSGPGTATLIRQGEQKYLFLNDTVFVGESSLAYMIERNPGIFYPWGMSFDMAFSGAPGTFEIDIQTADIDQDSHYVTLNSLTTGSLNTSNVGRVELPNFWAKYVRVKVVSFANYATVNLTVLLTR